MVTYENPILFQPRAAAIDPVVCKSADDFVADKPGIPEAPSEVSVKASEPSGIKMPATYKFVKVVRKTAEDQIIF